LLVDMQAAAQPASGVTVFQTMPDEAADADQISE
jgi:hypothetical protein